MCIKKGYRNNAINLSLAPSKTTLLPSCNSFRQENTRHHTPINAGAMATAAGRPPALSALLLILTLSPLLLSECDAYPILTSVDESLTKVSWLSRDSRRGDDYFNCCLL